MAMGGTFSRRKNLVERIGPARRQSMPSNVGGSEDTPATPRPETCPAVPSPAADALWAASARHGKRPSGHLIYRAPGPPGVGSDELSGLISTGGPILVKDWLNLVGLPQYAGAMEAAGWDDTLSCSLMTEADLRDVGIEKVGHRRRLLQAIESLGSHTRSRTSIALTAAYSLDGMERAIRRLLVVAPIGAGRWRQGFTGPSLGGSRLIPSSPQVATAAWSHAIV